MRGGSRSALNRTDENEIETLPATEAPQPGVEPHPTNGGIAHRSSEHSPWPVVLAAGVMLVAVGLLNQWLISALGGVVILAAIVGWLWQPWVS